MSWFANLFFGQAPQNDEEERRESDRSVESCETSVKKIIGESSDDSLSEVRVPTLFHWAHGGQKVYLCTNLDGWSSKRKMNVSTADFSCILDLPAKRKIQYRFEVDGVLMCDPEQKHVRGSDGGYVNEISVENNNLDSFRTNENSNVHFSQQMPDPDLYVRQPPHAPCHLGKIILNSIPDKEKLNPLLLPEPSHVCLNHTYVAERKEHDVMVLAVTQRFNCKYFTTVYYKHIDSIPKTNRNRRKSMQISQNLFDDHPQVLTEYFG